MTEELSVLSLQEIRSGSDPLPLDEKILGRNVFKLLNGLFPHQADFFVTGAVEQNGGDDFHLIFKGTFDKLAPWEQIEATFHIFDLNADRHLVFYFDIPSTPSAYVFLTQYSIALDEPLADSDQVAPYIPLADHLQEIEFPPITPSRRILFSSLDFSTIELNFENTPVLLKAILTDAMIETIQVGLNLPVNILMDANLNDFLRDQLGGTHDQTAECRGLVFFDEDIPCFKFRKPTDISTTIGVVELSLEAIEFALPLPLDQGTPPEIGIIGHVKIQNMLFEINAHLDLISNILGMAVIKLPTLRELNANMVLGTELTFPDEIKSLSGLLDVQLAEFEITLDFDRKQVLEIYFLLSQPSLALFSLSDGHEVSIEPQLGMRFYTPFDEENRSFEGDLQGKWLLGDNEHKTEIETFLSLPGYQFSASMAEDHTLDIEQLFPDTGIVGLKISQLEIFGDPVQRSFQASLGVSDTEFWKFDLANREFRLKEINLKITITEGKLDGCEIDCQLDLDGVMFYLSGQQSPDQGLSISGGTAGDSSLDIGIFANDLMTGLSLPENIPPLFLHNIFFSASPRIGEYLLSGQSAGAWPLTDGLELQVRQFSIEKEQSTPSVSGTLDVSLAITWTDEITQKPKQVDIYLSADKSAAENGGWQFEGSTSLGQRIPLGALVADLGTKFGDFTLPAVLEGLEIENLQLSFNSGSKNFTFSGDVKIPLEGQELDLALELKIENQGLNDQGKPQYSKFFGGRLEMDGLGLDVTFSQEGDGESILLASFSQDGGVTFNLFELGAKYLPSSMADLVPNVSPRLESGFFIYHKTAATETDPAENDGDRKRAQVLFALDMGSIQVETLGDLLVVGEYLADYDVSIGWQVVLASAPISQPLVGSINATLTAGLKKLPGAAVREGFSVIASIDLGGEPLQLSSGNGNEILPDAAGGAATTTGAGSSLAGTENPSSESASPVTWVAVQRSAGPLYLSRVGFQYQEASLAFLLDASINIGVLSFSLQGLAIRSPLHAFQPVLDLAGFGLSYRGGPVEITGTFMRQEEMFSGAAIIKAQDFNLTAFGSYGTDPQTGQASMFLYAVLDKELGGPAFFYVTGLALGFGYNLNLQLPPVAGVANFPLVQAVRNPPGSKPKLAAATDMLGRLNNENSISKEVGAYWIAAGVRFSSFQFIDSFALLLVKFGREFEIVLVGLSTLRLPKPPRQTGARLPDPYLYIELQFMVSVKPNEGVFRAEAQLTNNSYLIDPGSKISGGFAFYAWFAGAHNGDFVLTVGGYHPNFIVPEHYPQRKNVPPVAINWPLPQYNLSIKGSAYFAMTPGSVMAGGTLEAIYATELIWASFTARANFLVNWKPFHYDVDLSISVHVRATLDPPGVKESRQLLNDALALGASLLDLEPPPKLGPITIVTSLNAGLHLWGPPFAGTAHIQWEMISFNVEFGATQSQVQQLLRWDEFAETFLPVPKPNGQEMPGESDRPIVQINLGEGLLGELAGGEWLVDAETLTLSTATFIPADQLFVNGISQLPMDESKIGFRAMGSGAVASTHSIIITSKEGSDGLWNFETRRQGVAAEIWSPINSGKEPSPSAELLASRLVGVSKLRPLEGAPSQDRTPALELLTFKFDPLPLRALLLDRSEPTTDVVFRSDNDTQDIPHSSIALIKRTAINAQVGLLRMDIFAVARTGDFFPLSTEIGNLNTLAASADANFQSPPMVGLLGSTGDREQAFTRARPLAQSQPKPSLRQTAVRLTALLYQYRYLTAANRAMETQRDERAATLAEEVTTVTDSGGMGTTAESASAAQTAGVGGHVIKPMADRIGQTTLFKPGAELPAAQEVPPELDTHALGPNQSQVWQLTPDNPDDPIHTALEIEAQNEQRVRVVSLDRFGRPINDEVVNGSRADSLHPLSQHTTHLLVTALPGESVAEVDGTTGATNRRSEAVGWRGRSALIQLQPRVYVGDQVLIRTQASRQRLPADHSGVGLVDGMTAVNQNVRLDSQGNLASGWLRTYLPTSADRPLQTLAIALRRSAIAAEARPHTMVQVISNRNQRLELLPVYVIRESEAEMVLLYQLPGELHIDKVEASSKGYHTVLTEATPGWMVDGVMGIAERAGRVRANWAEHRLQEAVTQTEGAAQQTPAQVRVVALA